MKLWKGYGIAVVVSVLLVAGYTASAWMAERRSVERFNREYWKRAEKMDEHLKQQMYRVPGYMELLREKGMLSALVKMAASDSIGLCIDLNDSVAQLIVKGMSVRNISVKEISMSAFFREADVEAVYDLFSRPMQITGHQATIAKEPVNVVEAPQDSSDVIPVVVPDTTNAEPVFFLLETDQGIRFFFYQTEKGVRDSWQRFCFDVSIRWREMKAVVAAILHGRLPEYVPTIGVGVSKADAKVVYRALPWRGKVAVGG